MDIPVRPIKEWSKILVDTSILLSLLKWNDTVTDEVLIFCKKLITFLNDQKDHNNEKRTFLVSTISISEFLTTEKDQEKIRQIITLLDSNNVEFVDFDLKSGLMFNTLLQPYLSDNKAVNERAKELGFKTHEYAMAREWISRDYMINVSGLIYEADVVLSLDYRTFYPLSKDTGIFCALAYPDLFDHEGKFVLGYKTDDVQAFIEERKKRK